MNTIYKTIMSLGGVCTAIASIIALVALVAPHFRKKLKKVIGNLLGTPEIKKDMTELKSQMTNVEKRHCEFAENIESKFEKLSTDFQQHVEDGKVRIETDRNLLRNSLLNNFSYYLGRGYISLEELEVLQISYDQYARIGGNGVIQFKWENEILKLPNKPTEK